MSLLSQAAPFVGVPYLLHGRDPGGWDCWGCDHYLRELWLGKATPSWADAYSVFDCASAARMAETAERLILERMSAWTRVPPRPGAVILLTAFDRAAHVGLMLDEHNFIHAFSRATGTAINSTREPRWRHRERGCYDA